MRDKNIDINAIKLFYELIDKLLYYKKKKLRLYMFFKLK